MTVHCRGADFSVMGLWSYTLVMRDHINKLRKFHYAELVTSAGVSLAMLAEKCRLQATFLRSIMTWGNGYCQGDRGRFIQGGSKLRPHEGTANFQ